MFEGCFRRFLERKVETAIPTETILVYSYVLTLTLTQLALFPATNITIHRRERVDGGLIALVSRRYKSQ